MPHVGFEHTIPVFEWTEKFHALDRAAPVTGTLFFEISKSFSMSLYMFGWWWGGGSNFLTHDQGSSRLEECGNH
jgi:hypothetical protein